MGDTHGVGDGEGGGAVVDEQNFDFATIICVDCARAIENGDAVFVGEARARPDLGFKAVGQCDGKTCRDQLPLIWLQDNRLVVW